MKILHVPNTYFPVHGGTELLCQKVSESIVQSGHRVRVLTSDVGSMDGYSKFGVTPVRPTEETINGVEIRRVSYGGFLYRMGSYLVPKIFFPTFRNIISECLMSLIRKLFEITLCEEIKKFQPDVVMTLPHLLINVQYVLRAHEKKPFPLVMVPLLQDEDNWPTIEAAKALARANAVIASTGYEAERLEQTHHLNPNKIFTVRPGTDIPNISEPRARTNQVLFLGRKVLSKGIPHLLAAMRLVWRKRPDAELILAGAREVAPYKIEKLIMGLTDRERKQVKSLDNISEDEKSHLLSTCLCLVLPSRVEAFGIVLLEAWAHYMPVVTLNLPVFRDFVTADKDGLLTDPDDISSMADAILLFLENPALAGEMGRAGRKKVEQCFTWNKVAAHYMQAYEYAVSG